MNKANEDYQEIIPIGKLKNVLKGCKREYDLSKLTVIQGYNVIFSGELIKFEGNCDITMISYRNKLLEEDVAAKDLFNNDTHLFIFLREE